MVPSFRAGESLSAGFPGNQIGAAGKDPRFEPITPEELNYLEISVDVLSVPRLVADHSPYEPQKYGLIVTAGDRRGLLLPDIPGGKNRQRAGSHLPPKSRPQSAGIRSV